MKYYNSDLNNLNGSISDVAKLRVFNMFDDIEKPTKEVLQRLQVSFAFLGTYRKNPQEIFSDDVVIEAISLSAEILEVYIRFEDMAQHCREFPDNERINELYLTYKKRSIALIEKIRDFTISMSDLNNVTKYRNSDIDDMKEEED